MECGRRVPALLMNLMTNSETMPPTKLYGVVHQSLFCERQNHVWIMDTRWERLRIRLHTEGSRTCKQLLLPHVTHSTNFAHFSRNQREVRKWHAVVKWPPVITASYLYKQYTPLAGQAVRCFNRVCEILAMSTACCKAVVTFKLPGTGSVHSNCVIYTTLCVLTAQQWTSLSITGTGNTKSTV
jgi:hypothetical protein